MRCKSVVLAAYVIAMGAVTVPVQASGDSQTPACSVYLDIYGTPTNNSLDAAFIISEHMDESGTWYDSCYTWPHEPYWCGVEGGRYEFDTFYVECVG